MNKVGVRETIINHSADIGLIKYWSEEVVTAWNMTHMCWLDDSGEVSVNTAKRLERFCDFIKEHESLPLKEIAEQYCLKNHVPFITEDKKKIYLKLVAVPDNQNERTSKLSSNEDIRSQLKRSNEKLTKAKEVIKLLLWDSIKDVERAEQFLKEVDHD